MKINLEFNGTADEIMKEFQALGSILSSAALPSNVKSMNPEALSPDLGSVEQHPKMDAVENTTSAPKKATKAPEKAHPTLEAAPSAPTPEPVKSADPEPVKPAAPEPPAAHPRENQGLCMVHPRRCRPCPRIHEMPDLRMRAEVPGPHGLRKRARRNKDLWLGR